MIVKYKKLHPDAQQPTKKRNSDAGFDLYALNTEKLYFARTAKISTGIAIEIPDGYYAQLHDRSGLASKGVKLSGGVIDSEYRGELIVCLTYLSCFYGDEDCPIFNYFNDYNIHKGDKIAQIVFHPFTTDIEFVEVEELGESDRGKKGFGSSGR